MVGPSSSPRPVHARGLLLVGILAAGLPLVRPATARPSSPFDPDLWTLEEATVELCRLLADGAPEPHREALDRQAERILEARATGDRAERIGACRRSLVELVQLLWSIEPPPEIDRRLRAIHARILTVEDTR